MLYYAMLCCAMPCYAVLCYAMLCYAILSYAIVCSGYLFSGKNPQTVCAHKVCLGRPAEGPRKARGCTGKRKSPFQKGLCIKLQNMSE